MQPKLTHPLKWPGGKRWLVPVIKYYWESLGCPRLVEPFCGGMAIAFGLKPQKALLNDSNIHCVNLFRWIQKGLTVTIPTENDKTLFYQHRTRFNQLIEEGQVDGEEAAQLFYYLNRTGFNGLCRFNSTGGFNVPFGQRKSVTFVKNFREYEKILSNWQLTAGDFSTIKLKANDFIYADPPYDASFTQYTAAGFDWKDQFRLVNWLAKHKGPVVLSNQATERIEALYRKHGYQLFFVNAPRKISRNGDRKAVREVLALRNFPLDFVHGNSKFTSSLL